MPIKAHGPRTLLTLDTGAGSSPGGGGRRRGASWRQAEKPASLGPGAKSDGSDRRWTLPVIESSRRENLLTMTSESTPGRVHSARRITRSPEVRE